MDGRNLVVTRPVNDWKEPVQSLDNVSNNPASPGLRSDMVSHWGLHLTHRNKLVLLFRRFYFAKTWLITCNKSFKEVKSAMKWQNTKRALNRCASHWTILLSNHVPDRLVFLGANFRNKELFLERVRGSPFQERNSSSIVFVHQSHTNVFCLFAIYHSK